MRVSLEVFQEVIVSIKQNKLRSFLTCFSVAWGIFMLIVLLGSGNGLQNGMASQFSSAMVNSLWMSSDITSLDFNGIKKGRRIDLKNEDQAAISRLSKHIDLSSTRYTIPSTT